MERFDEGGVALVSGFSTNILTQVLGGEVTSPEEMMLSVLNKPEYDFVKEALKQSTCPRKTRGCSYI